MIKEVKIYGSLYGTDYDKRKFQTRIFTEDFIPLFRSLEPHTRFGLEPNWITVAIPDVVVIDNFYIFVYTSSPRTGGINIHYDSSVYNTHSEVIEGCQVANWYLRTPKHKVNWMIRVIGKTAKEDTPPISAYHKASEEFLETVNILDNPEKLSEWILDNIEYQSSYEEYQETGFDYNTSPDETFANGVGNCAEFAILACYVLEHHGYNPVILSIQVESKPWKGHAVCVYESSGSLYSINVGRIEGPFSELPPSKLGGICGANSHIFVAQIRFAAPKDAACHPTLRFIPAASCRVFSLAFIKKRGWGIIYPQPL